jgi:hypothetical protein
MRNLTPHPIVIQYPEGTITLPPSGVVARVATIEEPAGSMTLDGIEVPVVRRRFGAVEGLPDDYGPHAPVVVSSLVLEALRASGAPTSGVYAPDTGPTAVRDAEGRIVAVTRLVTA